MWTERVGYTRLVDMSGRGDRHIVRRGTMHLTMYRTIESFMYTSSLKRGNFKSDLTAGIFDGFRFVELDDSVGSLTYFLVHLSTSS